MTAFIYKVLLYILFCFYIVNGIISLSFGLDVMPSIGAVHLKERSDFVIQTYYYMKGKILVSLIIDVLLFVRMFWHFWCFYSMITCWRWLKEVRHYLLLNELAKKRGKVSQSKVTHKCAVM